MIADLKPYPAMKDSGVLWVGEVPEHWEVAAVKRHYSIQLGKMLQGRPIGLEDIEVPYLKAQHVQWSSVRTSSPPKMWASPGELKQFGVSAGDLLVCEGGEGGRCSLVREIADGYIIQNALHRVRSVDYCRNDFLQYVMSAVAATGYFDAINNKATIAHFTREKFGSLGVPVPSANEQSAIVRFLDHADRRIRRYIRAKKKLIELLDEQKQAIIHRAVTRGLDPNVRLKPSGLGWLEDVPEHWGVRALKQLLSRMDYGTSANLGREGRIRVLTMGDIQDGEVIPPDHGSLTEVPANLLVEKDDLMFNRTNSPELVGKVGIFRDTTKDVSFASYLVRLRTKPEHDPQWLNYLLNSTRFWAYARSQALVSLHQANLNSTRYGQMLLPIPPEAEQRRIAEFIASAVLYIRNSVLSTEREIDLLREYRTRLIADVVTGKLDVRKAAARLPEEIEEAEPLEEADAMAEGNEEAEGSDLDAAPEEAEA